MRLLVVLIILGSLVNCTPPNTTKLLDYEYFDVSNFAVNLLANQSKTGTSVQKIVSINGAEETKLIGQPDSSFWRIELAGLLAIDLNKPSLVDAYYIETGEQDGASNLLFDTYVAKDPESAVIKKLGIYYWQDKQEIRKIEFKAGSSNFLLKEEQDFTLWVNRYSGVLLIDSVKNSVHSQQFGKQVTHYTTATIVK